MVRRSPCHNPPPPLPCNDAQQGQRREPCALLFRGLRNPKQDSPPRLSFVVWKLVSRLPLGADRQPASVAARDYLVGIAWPLLLRGPRIRIGEGKEKPRSLADLRGILGEVSFVAAAGITAKQLPDRLTRRSSRIVASLATSFSWIFSAPRAILDSQLRRRRGSQCSPTSVRAARTPDELSQAAKLADQDGRPFDEELVVLIREGLAIRRAQPQSA